MNGKDILHGMSFIPDELVEEAESQSIRKPVLWKKLLPLAAGLCLVIGAATLFGSLMPGMKNQAAESASVDNALSMEYGGGNDLHDSTLFPQNSMTSQISDADPGDCPDVLTDFGVRLLRDAFSGGGNPLVSPFSVVNALGMTANGAKGETLSQMEASLGIPAGTLNEWVRDYTENLPQTDGGRLLPANSIWYRSSGLTVSETFLKTAETYYRAQVHASDFGQETLRQINSWVNDKTNGMIPQILEGIDRDAVMYLINALAFEAEWETVYREDQVRKGTFTMETGSERTVDFLLSQEYQYLENSVCTGFIKYYKDRNYAFVALLPNAGLTMENFLGTLDGQMLRSLLDSPRNIKVNASIPKFQAEYTIELSGILKGMGMELPFDPTRADFSGIGSADCNIYISKVIHKTFLQLDEQGTRAGAATAVMANGITAMTEFKTVELDRPFVYMLIDCEEGLPFFIGCMMDVTGEPTAYAGS